MPEDYTAAQGRVTAMAAGSYGRRALAHMRPTPYLASHWRFYIVIPALLTALLASCATLSPDSSLRGVEDLTKERTRQPFAMTTGLGSKSVMAGMCLRRERKWFVG